LPIALGDSVINPGDLLVGDRDGVVVIARDQVGAVINSLVELRKLEAALETKVKGGLTHMPWVDEYLRSNKVRYVE
jgi:regulator of RNase E activity RraA